MPVKEELKQYIENLQTLKLQAARYGMTVPVHILNDISYHEQKIEELEEFLRHDTTPKTVLILSQFVPETITSRIVSLGYRYKQRVLRSSTKNWLKIKSQIKELKQTGELVAAILYLNESTLLYTCDESYRGLWKDLLFEVAQVPSICFFFGDNLQGEFFSLKKLDEELANYESSIFPKYTEKIVIDRRNEFVHKREDLLAKIKKTKDLINDILNWDIGIAPIQREADIGLRVQYFFDEIEQGVFLQVYIPNHSYQADQFADLLKIFESYLHNIEGISFSIDTRRTEHGTTYLFKSKNVIVDMTDMDNAISRFNNFIVLCQNNPQKAEKALEYMGVASDQVSYIRTKYVKNYQRISLDMRHERDQKLLSLKQQLENDIFEYVSDQVLPAPDLSQALSNLGTYSLDLDSLKHSESNTQTLNSVEDSIVGSSQYNNSDRRLIQLMGEYAGRRDQFCLKTELDQLKDTTSSKDVRRNAKQKLEGFVYKITPALGKENAGELLGYLQNLYLIVD